MTCMLTPPPLPLCPPCFHPVSPCHAVGVVKLEQHDFEVERPGGDLDAEALLGEVMGDALPTASPPSTAAAAGRGNPFSLTNFFTAGEVVSHFNMGGYKPSSPSHLHLRALPPPHCPATLPQLPAPILGPPEPAPLS